MIEELYLKLDFSDINIDFDDSFDNQIESFDDYVDQESFEWAMVQSGDSDNMLQLLPQSIIESQPKATQLNEYIFLQKPDEITQLRLPPVMAINELDGLLIHNDFIRNISEHVAHPSTTQEVLLIDIFGDKHSNYALLKFDKEYTKEELQTAIQSKPGQLPALVQYRETDNGYYRTILIKSSYESAIETKGSTTFTFPFTYNENPECEIDCSIENWQTMNYKKAKQFYHDSFDTQKHQPAHTLITSNYCILGHVEISLYNKYRNDDPEDLDDESGGLSYSDIIEWCIEAVPATDDLPDILPNNETLTFIPYGIWNVYDYDDWGHKDPYKKRIFYKKHELVNRLILPEVSFTFASDGLILKKELWPLEIGLDHPHFTSGYANLKDCYSDLHDDYIYITFKQELTIEQLNKMTKKEVSIPLPVLHFDFGNQNTKILINNTLLAAWYKKGVQCLNIIPIDKRKEDNFASVYATIENWQKKNYKIV